MEFIELREFTIAFSRIATDKELEDLQSELIQNPSKGKLVAKTGGARKVRMRLPHQGKRGGARIIYYWQDPDNIIWLMKAYAKNEKQDLTENEKKELSYIISEIKRGEI
jgi:hypothetical protein